MDKGDAQLIRCGKNCRFIKLDWSAAYKQIRVHCSDIWMQGFEWLGMYFFELCLIFGGVSSPGIYDRVAKMVLHICRVLAEFPTYLVIQHLDDVCACSPANSDQVDRFYETYIRVCGDLGVKLADPSDPDKAFSPRTNGQVLGVEYDSTDMTWHLREDKMSVILNMLNTAIKDGQATARFIKKICGKLIDIRNLVPGAKFHLAHLLVAANKFTEQGDMENIVVLDNWCREDLYWFVIMLPIYSQRTELKDPDRKPDHWTVKSYSDAAGGSAISPGRGVGSTIFPNMWSFIPWGKRINLGWRAYDRKKLSHKMSAWELVGPLLTLVMGGNTLSGKQLVVYVDNEGSVLMYKKGWSTVCDLCNTLLLAIHQVSTALTCELFVCSITRCSTAGARAADALSKSDKRRFWQFMPEANREPEAVPEALRKWIDKPVPSRSLGKDILSELKGKYDLLDIDLH